MTVEELRNQLSGLGQYEKRTEEELRAQAENLYKGQYEQNLKLLRDNIQSSIAQQQRSALTRGMQRSSYNQAQQSLIQGSGLEASAQLGSEYSTNVATTLLNLMNTEYDRETAANQYRDQLLMALYEYQIAEDERNKAESGGGGGGGGGAAKGEEPEVPQTTDPIKELDDLFKEKYENSSAAQLENKKDHEELIKDAANVNLSAASSAVKDLLDQKLLEQTIKPTVTTTSKPASTPTLKPIVTPIVTTPIRPSTTQPTGAPYKPITSLPTSSITAALQSALSGTALGRKKSDQKYLLN